MYLFTSALAMATTSMLVDSVFSKAVFAHYMVRDYLHSTQNMIGPLLTL